MKKALFRNIVDFFIWNKRNKKKARNSLEKELQFIKATQSQIKIYVSTPLGLPQYEMQQEMTT